MCTGLTQLRVAHQARIAVQRKEVRPPGGLILSATERAILVDLLERDLQRTREELLPSAEGLAIKVMIGHCERIRNLIAKVEGTR